MGNNTYIREGSDRFKRAGGSGIGKKAKNDDKGIGRNNMTCSREQFQPKIKVLI